MGCVICFDEISGGDKPIGFKCGHKFHTTCISKWLLLNNTCPYCRNEVYSYNDDTTVEMEDNDYNDIDVSFVNETLFDLYNDTMLDDFHTYLNGAIDDIDSDYLRDWDDLGGMYNIDICIKYKHGCIWTQLVYIPDSHTLLVYFNEYKLYFNVPQNSDYLARYFKLDVENIVEPIASVCK